ncbi:MAG TPA: nuclear transport factor 2 family protein [Pyrinomonadaceae bacterium]|nr:nuclear transport factor 2 family protein [Pyrinomonadaceae bacterium]
MVDESERERLSSIMRQINRTWLDGRVEDLIPTVHPDIVFVLPDFAGRICKREAILEGFRDFYQNSTIHEFREDDHQVDIVGDSGFVTFRYEMVYERAAHRYRATGRDLWAFQKQGTAWLAVWRTMLDVDEKTD